MNDEYMIRDCLYEIGLRLVNANLRRISSDSDCGSVCIEVGIVLAVILTL